MSTEPPCILIFLKAPRPGLVKTRLAKTIGNEKACQVYRQLVQHTLSQIPFHWPLRIHFAPSDALPEMTDWLGSERHYIPQPEGDLGDRLRVACEQAFEDKHESVILLGGDCPGLTAAHLEECATVLSEKKPVLGPAEDGGYWLLGLQSAHPKPFIEMPWSTEQLLPLTLEHFQQEGTNPHLLETLFDVDDEATWHRCHLSKKH